MSDDSRLVQYASSGLIASGLLVAAGATALFPLSTSIGLVTKANQVPWSPKGFGGIGSAGSSPVFGILWSTIYTGEFVYGVALIFEAASGRIEPDSKMLFSHAACVYSALLVSSLWPPLFAEQKRWCFVAASIMLVFTAFVGVVGAIQAKPFVAATGWHRFGGAVTSIFAGWLVVAAALSVGIVTRAYNRGVERGESNPSERTFFPLVLSVLLAVLATFFRNPLLPAPLFVALFFVSGIFSDWRIWTAATVCGLSIGVVAALLQIA